MMNIEEVLVAKLLAERERLQARLNNAIDTAREQAQEIQRLRDALTQIATEAPEYAYQYIDIAKEALYGKEELDDN